MDEPITLNLTLKELQQIDKYVEVNDNTVSVLTKIKNAYPQPKMTLENEGQFSLVCYDGYLYYRLEYTTDVIWYGRLEPIQDIKTKNELESQWLMNDVKYQNDDKPHYIDDPEYCSGIEWDEKDNPPEPTSTVFRQKLFDGIKSVFYDPDYERTHWKMKVNMAVDEVLTHFYDIIPEPQEPICDEKEDGVFDEPTKPMDEVVDRLVKKYQAQKLWNRVRDELGYSIDLCDEIVDLVEDWIPEPQSAAGSQNLDTELLVDGFNDAIRKMKEMLR